MLTLKMWRRDTKNKGISVSGVWSCDILHLPDIEVIRLLCVYSFGRFLRNVLANLDFVCLFIIPVKKVRIVRKSPRNISCMTLESSTS